MQDNQIDDQLREAGTGIAQSLYGENAEISELQLLFALTELFRMKKEVQKVNRTSIFEDINIDIEKVAAELEQEINRLMPEPESPNYNKFLAMKAYSLNLRSHKRTDNPESDFKVPPSNPEFPERTVELLEPIKHDPVAVYFYVDALNLLGTHYMFRDHRKAIEYLLNAERTYSIFQQKYHDVKVALTPYQLFDVPREIQTLWCLLMAHHYTSIFLFSVYHTINNEEKKLKYAVHSIRAKISIEMSEKKDNKYFVKDIMPVMMDEIHILIHKWHFAQVNHLLAGFMANLVEYRRSLPAEQRHEVDYPQGLVSLAYAEWAYEVVHYSFTLLTVNCYGDGEEPNYSFYHFDDLKSAEMETYMNQFPCHRIDSEKKLANSVKKGKSWCQRAIDFIEISKDPVGNMMAKRIMDQLNILEHDLEYLKTI